ncbi:MAG: hypothetical protein ABIR56_02060 [Polaromonas sp.]
MVRHADGRRTQQGELSFFTIELNRLGACKSINYFDVPAEEYCAGWVTGYRCAAELLAALECSDGPPIDVTRVIEDAIQAGNDPACKPGRRGASAAFMEIMVEAVKFMGKHGNNGPWLERKIERAERQRDYFAEREARHRAEFSTRMKAARQAKRTTQAEEVAA